MQYSIVWIDGWPIWNTICMLHCSVQCTVQFSYCSKSHLILSKPTSGVSCVKLKSVILGNGLHGLRSLLTLLSVKLKVSHNNQCVEGLTYPTSYMMKTDWRVQHSWWEFNEYLMDFLWTWIVVSAGHTEFESFTSFSIWAKDSLSGLHNETVLKELVASITSWTCCHCTLDRGHDGSLGSVPHRLWCPCSQSYCASSIMDRCSHFKNWVIQLTTGSWQKVNTVIKP